MKHGPNLTPSPPPLSRESPSPLAGEGWGEGYKHLPNPIGLAAGYDRSGALLPTIARHGFGFVELGTVTPHPVADHNPGVAVLVANVERWLARAGRTRCLVGINLGRQPGAPIEQAARDFEQGMRAAWRCADYLAINLSGPANRTLLESRRGPTARDVLQRVREQATRLAAETGRRVPIVVKVPVVADDAAHAAAARCCREMGFDGLIAALEGMTGAEAERAVKRLVRTLGATTLIAVGGIRSPERARAYLAAGARLVQVYQLYAEAGPLALAVLKARCLPG